MVSKVSGCNNDVDDDQKKGGDTHVSKVTSKFVGEPFGQASE